MLRTIGRSLLFLLCWLIISGGFSLWLAVETNSTLHHQWWVHALVGLASWSWAFKSGGNSKGKTGVINLSDLDSIVEISDPSPRQAIRAAVVRQSGNEQKVDIVHNREDGLKLVTQFFSRKNADTARIWSNTPSRLDIRIVYYHGRGTTEGKVVRGVTLKIIDL